MLLQWVEVMLQFLLISSHTHTFMFNDNLVALNRQKLNVILYNSTNLFIFEANKKFFCMCVCESATVFSICDSTVIDYYQYITL